MTPAQWARVKRLFHETLDRPEGERAAALRHASAEDAEVTAEVERLLAAHALAGSFIETPATDLHAATAASGDARSGSWMGHYRLLTLLGRGGMGEVYQAVDSDLGRTVAIKVVGHDTAPAHDRLRQEARSASRLNHPNICTIHHVGDTEGRPYIVMELVEGRPLSDLIPDDGLAPAVAVTYGMQILDALAHAHAHGVVHRDLKSANVMLRPDGQVKLLDFGLARRFESAAVLSADRTATTVGGTLPYMAPEMLRGEAADARTDLWAFGVLLYEMTTGRLPFSGQTADELSAAILNDPPAPIPPSLPPSLARALLRCLEKAPEDRPRDAVSLRAQLEACAADGMGEAEESSSPVRPTPASWRANRLASTGVVALVLLTVLGVAAWEWSTAARHPVPPSSAYVQITNFPDSATQPALSPDGRMLTFIRGAGTFFTLGQIYVKPLPDGTPVQLTNDEVRKMSPVFSPDGSRIAYTTVTGGGLWDTWTVPVPGGAPKLWLRNASGLVWAGPQRVLFSEIKAGRHMGIVAASESRADARDVYLPSHTRAMAHRSYPSPDGQWVALVEMDGAGKWLPCRLVPFDGSSTGRQVGPPGAPCTGAAWSPDGQWIYLTASTDSDYHVWRERSSGGGPEQVTSGPTEEEGIAMAADGRSFVTSVGLTHRTVSIHDAHGDRQISAEGYAYEPSFSPDGRKLYYRILKGRAQTPYLDKSELWVADLESGRSESLLPGFSISGYDISGDGRRVVFAALDASAKPQLWLAATDHRFPPRAIPNTEGVMSPRFGPAGEVFFVAADGNRNFAFRIREDGSDKQKLTSEPIDYILGISRDARWLIGYSPVSGDGAAGMAAVAYPIDGGTPVRVFNVNWFTRWSADMRYFYVQVWSTAMDSGISGKTYAFPLPPGHALPDIPSGGFRSEAEMARFPGVRVINYADVGPGLSADTYAFSVGAFQRNLYRFPIR